jgi:hypothetical protein
MVDVSSSFAFGRYSTLALVLPTDFRRVNDGAKRLHGCNLALIRNHSDGPAHQACLLYLSKKAPFIIGRCVAPAHSSGLSVSLPATALTVCFTASLVLQARLKDWYAHSITNQSKIWEDLIVSLDIKA